MREEPSRQLSPEEALRSLEIELNRITEDYIGLWHKGFEAQIRQLLEAIQADKKKIPIDKIRELQQLVRRTYLDNKMYYVTGNETPERRRAIKQIEWCMDVLTALVIGIDMAQSQETNRSPSVEP